MLKWLLKKDVVFWWRQTDLVRLSLFRLVALFVLLEGTVCADSFVNYDVSRQYKVELTKRSDMGEASLREHTIVWHPAKRKYYLLTDVISLNSKYHPNTYESEIHLFSSKDLSNWHYHGVAIRKGSTTEAYDLHGVASPVAATLKDGKILCPFSARRTEKFTRRSVGLAYSNNDPEQIPWNKTEQPISDLVGEDDDTALVSDATCDQFHLYHRTAGPNGYQIIHRTSSDPMQFDSWSNAVVVAPPPKTVRAQELTGATFVEGAYHLFVIEHFFKGGAQIAHLVSPCPEGPFQSFQKNERYLQPGDQPRNVIYSGHITPVVKNGTLAAFFWTVSQKGKRYGLLGHPVQKSP
ncbi:Glycosyl hydrolases family 43 [Gimesia alba]|uniref:Glycosyl hydrolases family 43 n=1 Tax=Gimesia alba TaxID=2527973 RepID=A0A517RP40_9PLAN|nr:Glycosyl hydrolases family 43 [Gimesia alba]